jgi:hypothetical protein
MDFAERLVGGYLSALHFSVVGIVFSHALGHRPG